MVITHVIVSRPFLDGIYGLNTAKDSFVARHGQFTLEEEEHEISNLVGDCSVVICVVHDLALKILNWPEQRLFYHDSPSNLIAWYDTAKLISTYSAQTIRDHQLRGLQQCGQYSLQIMIDRVNGTDRRVQALINDFGTDFTPYDLCTSSQVPPPAADMPNQATLRAYLSSPASIGVAINSLIQMRTSQRCCAPTCLNTVADRRLQVCAGCIMVYYCSRRCQKRGWTHEQVGHGPWCSIGMEILALYEDLADKTVAKPTDDHEAKARRMVQYLDQLHEIKLRALYSSIKLQLPKTGYIK
jgi:hypothetical protein